MEDIALRVGLQLKKFLRAEGISQETAAKSGECPVSICVNIQRKRSYHSTGVVVDKNDWDAAKGKVKGTIRNAQSYNVTIGNKLSMLERELFAAVDRGDLSLKIAKVATRPSVSFYRYCESVFREMELKKQGTTATRYRNNLPSIKAYAGDELNIADIDKDWLKGYEDYCRTEKNARRSKEELISQNTIWSRFKMLRKVLLHAQEAGIIDTCPIGKKRGGHAMPVFEQVPKDYLTLDEVDKLLELMGGEGLTEHEDMVLSYFLVECTSGIRHSDWSRFKIEKLVDGEALRVRAKKTGEPVYVPIGPGSRLDRVLTHIREKEYQYTLTESAAANKTLKILAKVAGIGKAVTTHTGRHTAATLFLEKGFSRESVAEILGISIKVVDTYAKTTRQKLRNDFSRYGGL